MVGGGRAGWRMVEAVVEAVVKLAVVMMAVAAEIWEGRRIKPKGRVSCKRAEAAATAVAAVAGRYE